MTTRLVTRLRKVMGELESIIAAIEEQPREQRSRGRPHSEPQPCSVEGCASNARSRGFCETHYQRFRQYGDPLMVLTRQGVSAESVIELHNEGFNLTQVGEHLGVTKERVRQILNREGITKRNRNLRTPKAHRYKFPQLYDREFLEKRSAKSLVEIAIEVGCTPQAITRAIKAMGMPAKLENRSIHSKATKRRMYEERLRPIVYAMRHMFDSGATYKQVAARYNLTKIQVLWAFKQFGISPKLRKGARYRVPLQEAS